MKQGDIVRFREPQNDYERSALFVVIEDRDTRMAVRDLSCVNETGLLQQAWTVYATVDLETITSLRVETR